MFGRDEKMEKRVGKQTCERYRGKKGKRGKRGKRRRRGRKREKRSLPDSCPCVTFAQEVQWVVALTEVTD